MRGIRRRHKIKLEGISDEASVPDPIESFEKMQKEFGLSSIFMRRLKENGCLRPTPV